jgi:hypothetical protein
VAITAKDAALLPHAAAATEVCCDARTLVVGFADGCMVALSWSAKVRGGGGGGSGWAVFGGLGVGTCACSSKHICSLTKNNYLT